MRQIFSKKICVAQGLKNRGRARIRVPTKYAKAVEGTQNMHANE